MRKYTVIIFALLHSALSYAQWQPDVRLTYDTGCCYVSLNNARCISASGNFLHAVWSDERDGNREIYYKRSTDYGLHWGPDVRFTNNPASSWRPSVSSNGSFVHCVWCDACDGNFEIYYKRSEDNGANWSQNIRLTFTPNTSWAPSLAQDGNNLYIVWEETIVNNEEIFFKSSSDNGETWSADKRLTNDPYGSFYPSAAVCGSFVCAVWYDFRPGYRSIYFKRSTDCGVNWDEDTQLTFAETQSYNPAVCVSGSTVHTVWHDTRFGSEEVFYKRSTNFGLNWSDDVRITNNPGISYYPSMCVRGSSVHLAWYDNSPGNFEIYYDLSTDAGLTWQTPLRLTYDTADSYRPSITIQDSLVHIIWNDRRDGDWEMYYKRCVNYSVGVGNIQNGVPQESVLNVNYPNPFNSSTVLTFDCTVSSAVRIKIYDVRGRVVDSPVNSKFAAGKHSIKWSPANLQGGVYFCALYLNGKTAGIQKMILLK